jgi:hypothetical protein
MQEQMDLFGSMSTAERKGVERLLDDPKGKRILSVDQCKTIREALEEVASGAPSRGIRKFLNDFPLQRGWYAVICLVCISICTAIVLWQSNKSKVQIGALNLKVANLETQLAPYKAVDRLAKSVFPNSDSSERINEIYKLLKQTAAENVASLGLPEAPIVGFSEAGPFVSVNLKNFGKKAAENVEVKIVIANPAIERNYYFTKERRVDPIQPDSYFTLLSLVLTNRPGDRWVPPWPESYALLQATYSSENESKTNFFFLKHQPGHPAGRLLNQDATRLFLQNANAEETAKYLPEFKQRMARSEIENDRK